MSLRSQNGWLTEDLLDRIVAYLDDPTDLGGVWRGFGFMEANAIKIALRHGELHAYLTMRAAPRSSRRKTSRTSWNARSSWRCAITCGGLSACRR